MFDIFNNAGYQLFLVGGAVRDKLLGIPAGDLDYATDATSADVIDLLSEHGIKVIPTGVRFGTVTAISSQTNEKIEITTFRKKEEYPRKSRFPSVIFGDSIHEDLIRRDFKINAMALCSDGKLIDPYGGQEDLKKKIIDTPRDPYSAFIDDPLRILRAYRFAAKLGFSIADHVRDAVRATASELSTISAERKYKELTGLIVVPDGKKVSATLTLMKEDGVLTEVLPELKGLVSLEGVKQGKYHYADAWQHTLDVIANIPPIAILRWAALLHDAGKALTYSVDDNGESHFYKHEQEGELLAESVANRLRFSKVDRQNLCLLVRNHMRPIFYKSDWGNSAVKRLMSDMHGEIENLLLLAEADAKAHKPEFVPDALLQLKKLRKRISEQKIGRILPIEMGKQLAVVGFEGPIIGKILQQLEDMVIDGTLPENPTIDQCFTALWDNQLDQLS